MATPVIMPRQGQSVESCIITRWFKSPGENVQKGDILFSYETDKASFEAEASDEGILLKHLFEEGDEVPVLHIVAYIGIIGEVIPETVSETKVVKDAGNSLNINDPVPQVKIETTDSDYSSLYEKTEIKISPRAKNKAARLGLPINRINGTGPAGRIIEEDVLNAYQSLNSATLLARESAKLNNLNIPSKGTGLGGKILTTDLQAINSHLDENSELVKISNVRRIIAQKMHESLQNSAQLTHHTSADARAILKLRSQVKEAQEKGSPVNITINDMVCFAVIKALKKHPDANCHFLGNSIRKFNKVHLGIAVDTDRGLMVPALKNASDLSIEGLSNQLKSLAGNCKKGNVDPELLASEAASFTVSNLGSFGVEIFTPVINLPQVAILGVNTIIYRPADLGDGVFGFIPMIGLSLTYDHRALDGAPASAFLREIKMEIEKMEF